jgi:hypothetical protein
MQLTMGIPRKCLLYAAFVFFIALSLPLFRLVCHGVTLTGQYEESLGYRYFYSLRQLYDKDSYVFLPQGHLMDLADRGLQAILSAVGFSPTTLNPRIDLFAVLALEFAYGLTSIGFYWVARVCRNWYEIIIVGLLTFLPYLDKRIWGFNVLFQPDYPNWILAYMLVSAAAAVRATRFDAERGWGREDYLVVSTLTAAALAIKATLVIYPVALALILISLRRGYVKSVAIAILSGITGICCWALILLAYYNFRPALVMQFFGDERTFGSSVRPDLSYLGWLREALLDSDWLLGAAILMPLGVPCLLLFSRMRAKWGLLSGLFLGAMAYHAALYFRFQPVTWFEAIVFCVFCVISAMLVGADASTNVGKTAAYLTLIFACIAASVPGSHYLLGGYTQYLVSLTKAQHKAAAALFRYDDKIAFLLPDNSFRPLTEDSDIWKGGSNILDGNKFGASPLITSMFPRRDYFAFSESWYAEHPADLRSYKAVVFTIRTGIDKGPAAQLSYMRNRFHILDNDLKLHDDINFGAQRFLIWTQPTRTEAKTGEKLLVKVESAGSGSQRQVAVVTELLAARVKPTVIELSWPISVTGGKYLIEMGRGESAFYRIGEASASWGHYSVGDVASDAAYRFRARWVVNNQMNAWSAVISVPAIHASATERGSIKGPDPVIDLSQKTPLEARRISSTVIELSWSPEAATDSLEIEMASDGGGFAFIGRGAAAPRRYVVGDISPVTQYRFRARGWTGDRSRPWSDIVTVAPIRTKDSMDQVPTGRDSATRKAQTVLNGRRTAGSVIELSWPVESGQDSYEIEMATSDGQFVPIGRGASGPGNYIVGDVSPDMTYRFRARAWNGTNPFPWSNQIIIPPSMN